MNYNGILPIWKESGMTSHDVIFKLRKLLKMKKIGHSGTLDPEVSGVLPVCLGSATKVADYLMNSGKTYQAKISLGSATTTEDAQGEIIKTSEIKHINEEDIKAALIKLTGTIKQTPPMYSAVKVNGKKLYEYARQGIEIERPSREVTIHQLQLIDNSFNKTDNSIVFDVIIDCSKGTYIRTLAVQIGECLGVAAHMAQLVRSKSARFTKNECLTLQQVAECQNLTQFLYPLTYAFDEFDKMAVNQNRAMQFANGVVFRKNQFPQQDFSNPVVIMYDQQVIALYQQHPTKPELIKAIRVFHRLGE